LDALGEVEIEVLLAKFVLIRAKSGVLVDHTELDFRDFREILEVLAGEGVGKHRVVRAASVDPSGGGGLEIR
jgi:hypothetical protein